ncbi:LysR family transcriptional regulator [Martelella lutilitoris]|uniref:LysR family transcriptional regulator n=1 Tax=Martelella lutilitoris TaxID=2583532 RepID=A0A7T7HJX6_9HYPH|nr:LysR family transcriptional regulator [Martelella lutilitoris]QQM30538.1 LysR family transcriptional regulator [Martelella lutilitoris]
MSVDTLTIISVHEVLKCGGLRPAARALHRPPASMAAAVSRMEDELATPLVQKAGSRLSLTLEGRRLMPDIALAAGTARALGELAAVDAARKAKLSVSFLTLSRFSQVARSGSIRRAAREIGIGQPQLSRQISAFEADMNRALFVRSAEGIDLTPAGQQALALAETLEEVWKRLTKSAARQFRRTVSTCHLGSVIPLGYESNTARSLARLSARWLEQRPGAPLFISSTTADELMRGLQGGTYDVALLDTEAIPDNFERRAISRSRLSIVGPRRLIETSGGDVANLVLTRPVAVPSLKSGLRQKADALFAEKLSEAERTAMRMVEVDSLPIIINLVIEHDFVAVLPEAAFLSMAAPIGSIPLADRFSLTLSLVWPPTTAAARQASRILEVLPAID